MWLLYSGNFSLDQDQKPHPVNPPGGHYGLTFQKVKLLRNESRREEEPCLKSRT
jgi:hypothetical protein